MLGAPFNGDASSLPMPQRWAAGSDVSTAYPLAQPNQACTGHIALQRLMSQRAGWLYEGAPSSEKPGVAREPGCPPGGSTSMSSGPSSSDTVLTPWCSAPVALRSRRRPPPFAGAPFAPLTQPRAHSCW